MITAQYAGDSNYNGSVSTPVSQVVTMAAVTTTLAVSPSTSPLHCKTVVTLTASVLSGATPVHPGLVTFCDATAAAQSTKGLAVVGTAQIDPRRNGGAEVCPGERQPQSPWQYLRGLRRMQRAVPIRRRL